MYKSIFVPFTSNGDQTGALAFAASLATASGAMAKAVFSSKSLSLLDIALRSQIGDMYMSHGYAAAQELSDKQYQDQYEKRAKAGGDWFTMETAKLKNSKPLTLGEPLELFDEGAEQISNECALHDISVASFDLGLTIYDDVISGALFSTGRPLVLIKSFEPNRKLSDLTVTLAYKPSPPMLHAQWHAMPILQAAKRVLLLGVMEKDRDERAKFDRFNSYLSIHNIKAEPHYIMEKGYGPEQIEAFSKQHGSDMLIMGAYSHSRMRQLIFGGMTQYFLDNKVCNLFLSH
jgi:nucleotide-binding universal stress UspA family protein